MVWKRPNYPVVHTSFHVDGLRSLLSFFWKFLPLVATLSCHISSYFFSLSPSLSFLSLSYSFSFFTFSLQSYMSGIKSFFFFQMFETPISSLHSLFLFLSLSFTTFLYYCIFISHSYLSNLNPYHLSSSSFF